MNIAQRTQFKALVMMQRHQMKVSPFLKTGENRGIDAREGNYREVQDCLRQLHYNTDEATVNEAAGIIRSVLGRDLEVQAPPQDDGAARKLDALNHDSSGVTLNHLGVSPTRDQESGREWALNPGLIMGAT